MATKAKGSRASMRETTQRCAIKALDEALAAGGVTIGYGDGMIALRSLETRNLILSELPDEAIAVWEPASEGMAELRGSEYGDFLGYVKIVAPGWLNSRMCPIRRAVSRKQRAEQLAPGKAAHTPGPWYTSRLPEVHVWAAGTPRVAFVPLRDVSINEQAANAALISAAPDLFKAAKLALEWMRAAGAAGELGDMPDPTFDELEQAITKASLPDLAQSHDSQACADAQCVECADLDPHQTEEGSAGRRR